MAFVSIVGSRMNPNYGGAPEPTLPVLAVHDLADSATEGDAIVFEVRRTGIPGGTCSATWVAASDGGSADLTGTVTGTVTLDPGELARQVTVRTVYRTGTQGDREVRITLSAPGGCTIDSARGAASTTLRDRSVVISAYAYEDTPSVVLPVSDSKYDIWNIPAAGGTYTTPGDSSKILICVAPNQEVRGLISATGLKYRAAFLIGLLLRTRGKGIQRMNGRDWYGGQCLEFAWNRTITHRPVLFIGNIDYDSRNSEQDNIWGDWLGVGTNVDAANKTANMDQWMDFFVQKVKCSSGQYGRDNDDGGLTPHSDFVQPKFGGFRNAFFGDIDVRWGYQTFYCKGTNIVGDKCHPDGRNRFRDIMMRPMPDNPELYGGTGKRKYVYVIPVGVPSDATQVRDGNYQAVTFDRVYGERGGAGGADLKSYFTPGSTPAGAITYAGDRVTFPDYVAVAKGRPIWDGFVDFVEPATPVVNDAEVGYAVKVSTPSQLRAIFPNWWALPRRSGRAWASGVAYWMGLDNSATNPDIDAEEHDVALLDAGTGSSRARGNYSTPPYTSNVANWDGVIGGAVGATLDDTQTQMDWNTNVLFGIGDIVKQLPPSVPGGSGWINWVVQTIPDSADTASGTNPAIWTAIINGEHDERYRQWGARIVTKMARVGHPVSRLLIDVNREMNDPDNVYGILPGHRDKYQAAIERMIEQMRIGAGQHLRFVHRPAWKHKIGTYLDWVPGNIDVLSLSIHPDNDVTSNANITAMFNGTLDSGFYGLDEFLAAADTMGLPIAFPEWSPRFEAGKCCKVANTFVTRFYDEILAPNAARLVCECIYKENIRDTGAYKDGDAPGQAQWAAMVATRKTKWAGIQS